MTLQTHGFFRGFGAPASKQWGVRWVAATALILAILAAIPATPLGGPSSGRIGRQGLTETRTTYQPTQAGCELLAACPSVPPVLSDSAAPALGGYQLNRTLGWSALAPPPPGLGVGGGMVADSSSGTAVVFGGASSGLLINSTFAYTEANNSWSAVSTSNGPSPRSDFAFALDPTSDRGILFGGLTSLATLGVSKQTWAYSVTTGQWTSETKATAPPAREAAAFAIAPSLGIGILYGGWNRNYSQTGSITYSGLWKLNLTTFGWSQVNVTGNHPPPLEGAAVVWDPSTLRFDMFGGCYPCSSAVWQFDPASLQWTELVTPPNGPAARGAASWTYDPKLGADLLFGGTNGGVAFNDTYLFYPVNDTWVAQTLPPRPAARSDAVSGFLDVPGNETWLLSGGQAGSVSYTDLWRLSATSNLSLQVVNASAPLSPLTGAEVILSGRYAGITNFGGYLNLTQVDAGVQALSVYALGYYTRSVTLWLPPGQATGVTIDLTPEPSGTVFVRVLSLFGPPIPGADVSLTVNGTLIDPLPSVTDVNGNASFHGVPPGVVNVTAFALSWRPASVQDVLAPGGELSKTLVLFPLPFGTLAVSVLRVGDGLPIAGATVNASSTPSSPSGSFNETNLTDGLGISGLSLPPGTYFVAAAATGYLPSDPVVVAVITSLIQSLTIHLQPLPVASVQFLVLDATNGGPIDGASVTVPGVLTGHTDYAGYYNATGLPPRTYSVTVSALGYLSNTSSLILHPADVRTDVVNLMRAPPALRGSGWAVNLFPAGLNDLWPFLVVPLLLVVGGFVYASALRGARREEGPGAVPAFAERGPEEVGPGSDLSAGPSSSDSPR